METLQKKTDHERPKDRLKKMGPTALADSELLALVLGAGSRNENAIETARRILSDQGGPEGLIEQSLGALSRQAGLGEAKAARIVAAMELGIRALERKQNPSQKKQFSCSADIFEAYKLRLGLLKYEVFVVVGLNNKNETIKELTVAQGSVTECRVQPREVFRPMISEAAVRALLLHNHPSGDPTPSPDDVSLTRRLVKTGELLGIPILDHLVIGHGEYSSLRDLGLLST